MVMVCGSDKRRRAKKGEYLKREDVCGWFLCSDSHKF
jgi:hypothetical protein